MAGNGPARNGLYASRGERYEARTQPAERPERVEPYNEYSRSLLGTHRI